MARFAGRQVGRKSNPIAGWVTRLRHRVLPTYVDGSDLPDDPEPPYRARLHVPEAVTPDGMEVTEREVVRGTAKIVYEIRCACRRRWFQREFQRVHVCPRCGRAVLVEPP